MSFHVSALLFLLLIGHIACQITPHKQSAYQKQIFHQLSQEAGAASSEATPLLLDSLDDDDFRGHLHAMLPEIADESAETLLTLYRAEIDTAEIIHNLPAVSASGVFNNIDVDLSVLNRSNYLMNQWELAFLDPNRYPPSSILLT